MRHKMFCLEGISATELLLTPPVSWPARDAVAAASLHMIGIGRAASTKPCLPER